MAVVKRYILIPAIILSALAQVGADLQPPLDILPEVDRDLLALLEAFDQVLTAMAFAAAGQCLFSIVWAGFVLMAEGSEERSAGRAKNAVLGSVAGLALVLSAKAVALALLKGVIPIF